MNDATVKAVCIVTCKSPPRRTNTTTQTTTNTKEAKSGDTATMEMDPLSQHRTNSTPSISALAFNFCVRSYWPFSFSGASRKLTNRPPERPRSIVSIFIPSVPLTTWIERYLTKEPEVAGNVSLILTLSIRSTSFNEIIEDRLFLARISR